MWYDPLLPTIMEEIFKGTTNGKRRAEPASVRGIGDELGGVKVYEMVIQCREREPVSSLGEPRGYEC